MINGLTLVEFVASVFSISALAVSIGFLGDMLDDHIAQKQQDKKERDFYVKTTRK